MEKIGQAFQTARLKKKISLEEASGATKIKAVNLRALEEGDLTSLPSPAYARGFIKIYARYLGIDSAPLLKAYETFFRSSQPELILIERRRLAVVPWLPPVNWKKLLKIVAAVILVALVVMGAARLFRALRLRSAHPAFPLYEEPVGPGGAVLLESSLPSPAFPESLFFPWIVYFHPVHSVIPSKQEENWVRSGSYPVCFLFFAFSILDCAFPSFVFSLQPAACLSS